jgi:hypothetical protein
MSGHTPGPWTFYTEPQPNGCPIVGAKGLMVAMLAHSINHDDQRDTAIANARLIAATPMLLEKVRQYANECGGCDGTGLVSIKTWVGGIEVDNDDQPCPDCADIRAAIAAATGETK